MAGNLYAGAAKGKFAPGLEALPARVYVPDEQTGDVIVIDPATRKIVSRMQVGPSLEHITPDWDLSRLLVNVTYGNRLTPIDIHTGKLGKPINVPGPYNLYFTLDGRKAMVIRDSAHAPAEQVYFYDRTTWKLLKTLVVDRAGADHADMSPDGRFMFLSCEYAGYLVKIDLQSMEVVGEVKVGGSPVDVRISPDGSRLYVTNQKLNGVTVLDAINLKQLEFIRTASGAHGLSLSRDATKLYVTNRYAGSLSVLDMRTGKLLWTRTIGATPDMISVSADGTELWISNRYDGTVSVVSASTGKLLTTIRTGGHPHGLAYFPQPGTLSLGHNGLYR